MDTKLLLSVLFIQVFSHSWLECTMYTGDLEVFEPDKCLGRPRPLAGGRNVGGTFGQDIGMDFRPQTGGNRCQGDAAGGTPTQVTYEAGKTYTLAWPPKNHVAASCTNANIPDAFLRVYMAPYNGATDPTQEEFKLNQVKGSFSDDPHKRGEIDFKGFQNCPRFCENTDKSLCTGTITIPSTATPGVYTFQWYWAFNSETDLYATCWEAEVAPASNEGGNGDGNTDVDGGNSDGSTPVNVGGGDDALNDPSLPVTTKKPEPCFNCCKPKQEVAQGTGRMIDIPSIPRGTNMFLDCPEGYEGELKYMCLEGLDMSDEARIVNGECQRKCPSVEEGNDAAVAAAVVLGLTTLGLMIYILFDKAIISLPSSSNDDSKNAFPGMPAPSSSNDTKREAITIEKPSVLVEQEEWHYVNEHDETIGPVTASEFKKWASGIGWSVACETYVWNGKEVSEWTKLSEVPQLREA